MSFTEVKASQADWERLVYNLTLVAPGRGEKTKTVSRGTVRLSSDGSEIVALASDDILSLRMTIPGHLNGPLWTTVEALKATLVPGATPKDLISLELAGKPKFSAEFDQRFWVEHVLGSISGPEGKFIELPDLVMNPDRLRKFNLLKQPDGPEEPLYWSFVEWADRDIIRWSLGSSLCGVYVPLG